MFSLFIICMPRHALPHPPQTYSGLHKTSFLAEVDEKMWYTWQWNKQQYWSSNRVYIVLILCLYNTLRSVFVGAFPRHLSKYLLPPVGPIKGRDQRGGGMPTAAWINRQELGRVHHPWLHQQPHCWWSILDCVDGNNMLEEDEKTFKQRQL